MRRALGHMGLLQQVVKRALDVVDEGAVLSPFAHTSLSQDVQPWPFGQAHTQGILLPSPPEAPQGNALLLRVPVSTDTRGPWTPMSAVHRSRTSA